MILDLEKGLDKARNWGGRKIRKRGQSALLSEPCWKCSRPGGERARRNREQVGHCGSAFHFFASFHFMAVFQVTNYDPSFTAVETEAKKSRVTSRESAMVVRFLPHLHTRPHLYHSIQSEQKESSCYWKQSGRSPRWARLCLQPGELGQQIGSALGRRRKREL